MKPANNLEEKIIEAAKKLFMEKGFEESNMSDIAAKAEIRRATLHYYFRTKDKMFQAVFGSLVQAIIPKIKEIFSSDISFTEKLSCVIDEYFAVFANNPALPRFILGEVQRDISHLFLTLKSLDLDTYMGTVQKIILKEMDEGRLKKVSIPVVFLTFYSQLLFPFLTKNLLKVLFLKDDKTFKEFMPQWKENILKQMTNLLIP